MTQYDDINSMTSDSIITNEYDEKTSKELEEKHGKAFFAVKNEEYGIGVFISEDGEFGVYGDNQISYTVICAYVERNEKQVEELDYIENIDELGKAMSDIVARCIRDFIVTWNAA